MSTPPLPEQLIAENQLVTLPAPAAPPGPPVTLRAPHDALIAEGQAVVEEIRSDEIKSHNRFQVRPRIKVAPSVTPNDTLLAALFEPASNIPCRIKTFYEESTYSVNTLVMFQIITDMNNVMMSTKRWIDSCGEWNPFVSYLYFSILIYVKLIEARKAAALTDPGVDYFLNSFYRRFAPSLLSIPGPLVEAFNAITAFSPGLPTPETGPVIPAFPATPGWNATNLFSLGNGLGVCLPNPGHIINRMRTIFQIAINPGINDTAWYTRANGPTMISTIYDRTITDDAAGSQILIASGLNYAQSTNREFWKNAAARSTLLHLPEDPDFNAPPEDNWFSFFRFDTDQSWFSAVIGVMNRFSQFWYGTVSFNKIPATMLASPGYVVTPTDESTMVRRPPFVAAQGNGTDFDTAPPGNGTADNRVSYFKLYPSTTLSVTGHCTIRDFPEGHYANAVTFCPNMTIPDGPANPRAGPFWTVRPNTLTNRESDTLSGIRATMSRRFYSFVARRD